MFLPHEEKKICIRLYIHINICIYNLRNDIRTSFPEKSIILNIPNANITKIFIIIRMLWQHSEHVIQLWQITGGLMFIGTHTEKESLMFLALNLGCPGDSIDQYNLLVICGTKMCETLALRVFIYNTRFTASVL